jgi:hypothetical protein
MQYLLDTVTIVAGGELDRITIKKQRECYPIPHMKQIFPYKNLDFFSALNKSLIDGNIYEKILPGYVDKIFVSQGNRGT